MFKRKGIDIKTKLSDYDKQMIELNHTFGNADWLSKCISYGVNGKWYIRDKQNNNKIIETFNSYEQYDKWINMFLYYWE